MTNRTSGRRKRSRKPTQKTITRARLSTLAMVNSAKLPPFIELDGVRKEWVGIGWIDDGPPQGDEVQVVA